MKECEQEGESFCLCLCRVFTQVENHHVHGQVLLDEEMGVSAEGVKDG